MSSFSQRGKYYAINKGTGEMCYEGGYGGAPDRVSILSGRTVEGLVRQVQDNPSDSVANTLRALVSFYESLWGKL